MVQGVVGGAGRDQPHSPPARLDAARSAGTAVAQLPQVVVLLSTYNGAAYLEAQLESLRVQQGVSVRLHARDDGSTDGTCAILRRYQAVWPDLIDMEAGPNLRAAASFLRLLHTAPQAEYYAFCDQDDIWQPDKLARAIAALEDHSEPALYCSTMTLVDQDLKVLTISAPYGDLSLRHLLFENVATGCTMVFNAAARKLIDSLDPSPGAILMHDWWCALVITALGTVRYDARPTVLYRQHGGNVVGFDTNRLVQIGKHLARLRRQRRSFYPVHAQAAELLKAIGPRLSERNHADLAGFTASKRSLGTRVRYAVSGPVTRQRTIDAVMVRCLILLGWY